MTKYSNICFSRLISCWTTVALHLVKAYRTVFETEGGGKCRRASWAFWSPGVIDEPDSSLSLDSHSDSSSQSYSLSLSSPSSELRKIPRGFLSQQSFQKAMTGDLWLITGQRNRGTEGCDATKVCCIPTGVDWKSKSYSSFCAVPSAVEALMTSNDLRFK